MKKLLLILSFSLCVGNLEAGYHSLSEIDCSVLFGNEDHEQTSDQCLKTFFCSLCTTGVVYTVGGLCVLYHCITNSCFSHD